MARRASSSVHPVWMLAVLVIVVAALGGGYLLVGKLKDPYRTIPTLDVPAYLENSNSLRGNTYKATGTVWNSLAWSPTVGRLFSIEIATPVGVDVLPVLIPVEFNHINIQKGQRFVFKIEVNELGVLLARDMNKA